MADITKVRITGADYVRDYPQVNTPMELIDGEVIVSPVPFNIHQKIVTNLIGEIGIIVKTFILGELRVSPSDVHFDEFNVLQPDVFFVANANQHCKLGKDNYWHGAPDFCIEVLSEGTEKKDRGDKFTIYEKYGVREYWLIDPIARKLQVYVHENGKFVDKGAFSGQQTVSSTVIPQFNFTFGSLY